MGILLVKDVVRLTCEHLSIEDIFALNTTASIVRTALYPFIGGAGPRHTETYDIGGTVELHPECAPQPMGIATIRTKTIPLLHKKRLLGARLERGEMVVAAIVMCVIEDLQAYTLWVTGGGKTHPKGSEYDMNVYMVQDHAKYVVFSRGGGYYLHVCKSPVPLLLHDMLDLVTEDWHSYKSMHCDSVMTYTVSSHFNIDGTRWIRSEIDSEDFLRFMIALPH